MKRLPVAFRAILHMISVSGKSAFRNGRGVTAALLLSEEQLPVRELRKWRFDDTGALQITQCAALVIGFRDML